MFGRPSRQVFNPLLGLFLILLLSGPAFAQLPSPVATPEGPEHDNPLARVEWFRRGRVVPGKPGAAARLLQRAYRQKMQLRARRSGAVAGAAVNAYSGLAVAPATTSSSNYGGWVPLGPAPISSNATGGLEDQDYGPVVGRATSVVVDPGDPTGNTVYLGGAYGGLWKSTNAAAASPAAVTWTPLLDQQATLAVGSVAVQPSSSGPSNVVLVGTGEADFSIDSYYGLGILRSADGGSTWTLINSDVNGLGFSGQAFAKIAFSTDNPNLVVAASTGAGNDEGASSVGLGNQAGLYSSTDGGQTWAETFLGLAPGVGATSVVYDSASHKFFAFVQFDGFYVARDGMTWNRLASQPGTALQNCPVGNAGVPVCNVFRAEMAVVPGREELYTWYVTIDQQGNVDDGGIYRTTNGGATWQQINDSGMTNCGDGAGNGCGAEQGWFNLTLAAVPNGSGTDLYAGAVNLFKCSITGANSSCGVNPFINLTHVYGCTPLGSLSHVHPDQHGISFLRPSPSQALMYFANDGGIYRALNGYALKSGTCGTTPNPFQNLNGTMGSMAQFVDFSNSPDDAATLVGGTQDNGSPATDVNHGANWISVNGGDGGFNAIDPHSSDTWFTSNTDVSVQRCDNGINCLAQTFNPIVTSSTVGGDHGFFYTPFILDPQASSRMLVGTCRIWRGNSDGSGFSPLSYNLDSAANQSPNRSCSGSEVELIRSFAASGPASGNGSSVIYVGTEGGYSALTQNSLPGSVWVTNNADLGPFTWANLLSAGGAYAISGLAVDPGDPSGNTAYAAIMGFSANGVMQTTDQGLTWTPIGGQLPKAPVNAILVDPDDSRTLYAATDVGVYMTHDLQNWSELGQLPNVAVLQLKMYESGGVKQLRAGTYGRGVWSYDIPYQIRLTAPRVHLYSGQSGTIDGVITAFNGYSSSVDIECAPPVNFGTCTGTTVTPMPSGAKFSLPISAVSGAGDSTFDIQGTGSDPNATVESTRATVSVIDYFVGGLSSLAVNQGGTSPEANLLMDNAGSFFEPITLSCLNLPANAACNFYPSAVLSRATSWVGITVAAASTTPTGTYTITVSATSSGQPAAKTTTFPLTVGAAPDYSMTAAPPTGSVVPGGTTTAQISLASPSGYTGPVTLACSGVTCSFNPSGPIALTTTPVTVLATVTVPADWRYQDELTIGFTGTAPGTAAHYAAVDLQVADFGLTVHTSPVSVAPGNAARYELLVTSLGQSFPSPISFSCSGLPQGATCSFSPASVIPNNGPAIVVLSVSSTKTLAGLRPPQAATQAELMACFLLPGLVLSFAGGRRDKRFYAALLLVALAALLLLPSCGGGGTSAAPPPPPAPAPTPSAPPTLVTYPFILTATSGPLQHQTQMTLVVQSR